MSLKDDFESGFLVNPLTDVVTRNILLPQNADGSYSQPVTQTQWLGYQAATDRAVRIVETCKQQYLDVHITNPDSHDVFDMLIDLIKGETS